MEVTDYSDKSIVVYGETKPWANNLKSLNGRFNKNLRDGPGWIFSKKQEENVQYFVQKANDGEIEPTSREEFDNIRLNNKKSNNKKSNKNFDRKINKAQYVPLPGTSEKHKQELSFPNVFIAGDNVMYQMVMYTIELPKENQKLKLTINNKDYDYYIKEVLNSDFPYDKMEISPIDEYENPTDDVIAVIINGEWKIENFETKHKIQFL